MRCHGFHAGAEYGQLGCPQVTNGRICHRQSVCRLGRRNKLVEEAIIRMLAQLDPHSTYNDAEEVKKMNEPLQGNFEGIGVQFQMIEDTLLIIQPVSNGPSEKVGILAGDRIVAVNDSAIAGVKCPQKI